MKPCTISIVEDNQPLAEELQALFDSQPDMAVLDVFPSAEIALERLAAPLPEMLVVDIRLPGMNGVELISALKRTFPDLPILVLTMYDESDLIFDALKAGASGYLLKRATGDELCDAVRQVRQGGAPMSPSIARKVVQSFRAPPSAPGPEATPLSPREEEVLGLLANGALYKEIASTLGISMDTVRTHLRRIYDKFHVHTRTEAVVKYLGQRK
ncbi:response regulator transcription factor [Luteolibacter flavescens]|uniref:Response regulator transcription factor n=1 Tax=Luteolibacter flavescens TaxID=1859460 RepID=A0ABT3FVP5_9BACT|nr:response regulator transcription factor [Luteolibacter flavescens]MCW1887652.1 response regulator transcription factor [Luteolibacter flavescens]